MTVDSRGSWAGWDGLDAIVTRVPGQGWTADGLEVRMRPDWARQFETHVQGTPASPARTGCFGRRGRESAA